MGQPKSNWERERAMPSTYTLEKKDAIIHWTRRL